MRVFGLSLTTKCSLVQFREEVSAEKKTPNGSVCACSSVCERVCVYELAIRSYTITAHD